MSQSQPDVPPSSGLIEGKYQLVGIIGRGGMGSVWEARHVSLGTRFAIKFIEAEYADSQEARSRFDKEARAAATIQSKHAIQIFDHGVTHDGKPFIVMEFLQGEPLDKRIERSTLTLPETAHILQQVCRGLARAHERGIIHRDLKPENIFLVRTPDDDDEIAKVLDFGIAKIQSSPHNPGISSTTKTGAVLGTPFYMSPEQARGLRNVDHRTDVWSLGVIAFKCVTGRLPFDGESVGDLLVKICTAPIPVPSQFVPGLPSSFDGWFLRALEREPDRRFGSVQELGESLAYAAGLAPRGPGSYQAVISGLSTVASSNRGPGAHASHPVSHAASPYGNDPRGPQMTPHAGMPGAHGASPAAAGMTAAPFTSSTPAPIASATKGKHVVLAAILGLAVAGVGTGVAYRLRRSTGQANVVVTSTVTSGLPSAVISNEPPATAKPLPDVPPLETPEPPPAVGATTGVVTKTTTAVTKPVSAPTTTAPTKPSAKPAEKPPQLPPPSTGPGTNIPSPVSTPSPGPTTNATTAPAPPPPKKPNKNDPGY